MNTMKLPVGIDDFRKLRESDFYYVDKTRLIEQILQSWSEVTLFTRPRRFGKTLNMSMLKSFFEIGTDKSLFDGLYISGNKELCEEYMGKYPVVFLSLKSVEGTSFDEARYRIIELISREAERFKFLKDSEGLSENDKNRYNAIISVNDGKYAMDEKLLISSLQVLSQLLFTHFGRKAIIIVDEYDVPLDKAFQNGYYNEMVSLIRGIFGMALKTNEFLQFAVLTGCLRISKESIFTGLNNFRVMSITDARFDEQFGFTDNEVRKLLEDYNMSMHYNDIKEWYDGYHFGKADVYCPWDVMNYLWDLTNKQNAKPVSYWKNTSDNAIIRSFIDYAGSGIQKKMEKLMAGDTIDQKIEENLTYDYLHSSEENFWSILYLTGYLTRDKEEKESADGKITLKIPNKEIREIFETTVKNWFNDQTQMIDRKAFI